MKKIYLIHGQPGNGKTTLARRLKEEFGMETLSVDQLYVDFVKTRRPELYFKALNSFISPHFEGILRGARQNRWGQDDDPLEEWKAYLFEAIREASDAHDSLVVEGYLLYYDIKPLMERLSELAPVFRVRVRRWKYRALGCRMTAEEIAALSPSQLTAPSERRRTPIFGWPRAALPPRKSKHTD